MPQLFPIPDASGLKPLILPESIASNLSSGSDGHPSGNTPSPDAVDRFQKAISTPVPPIKHLAATIAAIQTSDFEPQNLTTPKPASPDLPNPALPNPALSNHDLPNHDLPNHDLLISSPAQATNIPEPPKVEVQYKKIEVEGEKVEVQISKFEDQGEKKIEVSSEKIVEVLGEKIETPEKLDALGKLELLGGKAEVPDEKIEAIGDKIKVPGEKIIEVIDDKIKVPGEKIEVLGGKLETLEKLELPGEKLVNAEGRLQAIGPTVEKPQPSNVERLASNLERPVSNLERPVSNIERPASNIERPASNIKLQASNVERSSDLAESPKTDGVVIPVAVPFAQDAPVVQAAPATIEIDPSAATARTSELTEAASAVAKTISVTPALSRGDGEVVIRLKPTVLDGSEIRIEAKGSAITIDISPASAEAAQIVERSQAQFAQQLAERMPSFQFTVATTTRQSYDRKATSNETT